MAKFGSVVRGRFELVNSAGSSPHGKRTVESVRGWTEQELCEIEGQQQRLKTTFAETHARWNAVPPATQYPSETAFGRTSVHAMRTAAWLFLVLECVISTGLMVMMTSLGLAFAAVVGCFLAVTLAFGAKASFVMAVSRFEEAPRMGREWLARFGLGLAAIEALLIAALLVMRGSVGDWALSWAWAFGPVLGMLGVLTPILGGVFFTAADWCGWALALEQTWRRNERLTGELRELLQLCDTRCRPVEPGASEQLRDQARALAAAVVFALLSSAGAASAEPVHQVFVDRSASVAAEPLGRALEDVTSQILRSWTGRATRWEFIVFSRDAYVARGAEVLELPTYAIACPELATEALKILPALREAAERKCRTRELQRAASTIAEIKGRLLAARVMHSCTAINDLLLRISRLPSGSVVYAITDGLNTCRSSLTIPTRTSVLSTLLLLPTESQNNLAAELERRKAVLQRRAPWLLVRMPWEFRDQLGGAQ